MLKGISSNQALTGLQNDSSIKKLKQTCADFESLLLTYLLKSMRTTIPEDGIIGNTHEGKIIKSMFDENMAMGIARSGGIGLGKILFEQLMGR
ncbi:MAG: rod-binding protein [Thermodesulfobacteriota bacterium]|nr:rod-binding protein [Thermodesulfobacteriota bacterium]